MGALGKLSAGLLRPRGECNGIAALGIFVIRLVPVQTKCTSTCSSAGPALTDHYWVGIAPYGSLVRSTSVGLHSCDRALLPSAPTGRRDRNERRPRCSVCGQGGTHDNPNCVPGRGEDPVKLGLVASLARPGGNLTGVNLVISELTAKRLGLLRELVPGVARVAVLVNPANATNTEATLRDVEPAARAMGLQIQIFKASTSREIEEAFATLVRERPDAALRRPRPLLRQPARPIGPPRGAPRGPRDIFGRVNLPKPAG